MSDILNEKPTRHNAMRVVITGGAGFIGSHLADRLIDCGYTVTVLDNLSTGHRENIAHLATNPRFTFVQGSVLDRGLLREVFSQATFVFHQAAIPSVPRSTHDPYATHEANATGTLLALMAARDAGVAHVVMASSSSVYGDTPTLPKTEDMPPRPLSPYAVSKLAAEAYCTVFTRVYGLPTTILRYFNVYGPRQSPDSQYAAAIPRFIRAALSGTPLTLFGSGEQTRDFTYVGDVVEANLLAATSGVTGLFNIGAGRAVTVRDLANTVRALTQSTSSLEYAPERPGDIAHSRADITRAGVFGWHPQTPLLDGLRATIAATCPASRQDQIG